MEPGARNTGSTVVVVDDDPELNEALADALTDAGFVVDAFTEPVSALERLRSGPRPDVVIVDYLMPVMDGEQFVRALADAGVDVPVLLLSGRARDKASERSLPVGMVLQKPVRLEHLLDGLGELLATRRTRLRRSEPAPAIASGRPR